MKYISAIAATSIAIAICILTVFGIMSLTTPITPNRAILAGFRIEPSEIIPTNGTVITPDIPSTYINNTLSAMTLNLPGNRFAITKTITLLGTFTTTIVSGDDTWVLTPSNTPAQFIFNITDSIWTSPTVEPRPLFQKFPKLVGSNVIGFELQGTSVALSGDNTTLAFGGPSNNGGVGAVWVFNALTVPPTQQAIIVPTDAIGFAQFGVAVALSNDGNTMVIGGSHDNSALGAIWIFTRKGTSWFEQVKLVPSDPASPSQVGASVSITPDGNTVAAGAPSDGGSYGAAWVWQRNVVSNIWTQVGNKIAGTGGLGAPIQGSAVALSPDASLLVVGGPGQLIGEGAIWLFALASGAYSQLGGLIQPNPISAAYGSAAKFSSDGSTLAVGAKDDNTLAGAVYVYTVSPNSTLTQQAKLIGAGARNGAALDISADGTITISGAPGSGITGLTNVFTKDSNGNWSLTASVIGSLTDGSAAQGTGVAVSSDGTFLFTGGPQDASNTGALWEFSVAIGNWGQVGQKFIGANGTGEASQGTYVALSADGNILVEGGPQDHDATGAAWVFNRLASNTWVEIVKLVGTNTGENSLFGQSVAISADGGTIAIGGNGAVWMFFFDPATNTWTQQAILAGAGIAESLSSDGNTLAVGNPVGGPAGDVAVYVRSSNSLNGTWSLQATLQPGDATGASQMGTSVAISNDGNTITTGGPIDDFGVGAVWVFVRNTFTLAWTQQGTKLSGSDEVGNAQQGTSIAISADGNTLAFGGPTDFDGQGGAAWVFTRSGTTWTQQGTKITNTDGGTTGHFGTSISLTGTGNLMAVGAPTTVPNGIGNTRLFARSGSTWSEVKLFNSANVPSMTGNGVNFGQSVALSQRGNRLAVGGPGDSNTVGAVWTFV